MIDFWIGNKHLWIESDDYRQAGRLRTSGISSADFAKLLLAETEEGFNVVTTWAGLPFAYPCDVHYIYPDAIMTGCEPYEEGTGKGG
jgi:hypothetical protein